MNYKSPKLNRYQREPQHDKRIQRGDDYAGDAWRDQATGALLWVVVGHNPNEPDAKFAVEAKW